MERRIIAVLETPDTHWRVEQHRLGRRTWYRIYHDGRWLHDVPGVEDLARVIGDQAAELRPVDVAV